MKRVIFLSLILLFGCSKDENVSSNNDSLIQGYINEINNLKNQLNTLTSTNNDLNQSLSSISNELNQIEQNYSELQTENQTLNELITSLQQQIDSLTPDFTNTELIQYFKDIALGFEEGNSPEVTYRWETDINLFLGGNISDDNLSEINRIKDEINELITTDISFNIVNDSINSNHYLYIGLLDDYNSIFPDNTFNYIGSFFINYGSNYLIYKGRAFVDSRENFIKQKHLIREELTQSLGLGKDSYTYPESIFYQDYSTITEYAEIDKELIKLLYHPDMLTGLNESEVEALIQQIIN